MRSLRHVLLLGWATACGHATPAGGPASEAPTIITGPRDAPTILLGREGATPTGILPAPIDRVWDALPVAYQTLDIPVQVREPGERALGTRRFTGRRLGGRATEDLVRCGNQGAGPSAVGRYRILLSIVTTLRAESPDRTALTTEVEGVAEPIEGTSRSRVRCVSTGEVEQWVYRLVEAQLKAGR